MVRDEIYIQSNNNNNIYDNSYNRFDSKISFFFKLINKMAKKQKIKKQKKKKEKERKKERNQVMDIYNY